MISVVECTMRTHVGQVINIAKALTPSVGFIYQDELGQNKKSLKPPETDLKLTFLTVA